MRSNHQFWIKIKAKAQKPIPTKAVDAINRGGYLSAKCPDGTLSKSESAPESEKASATFCAQGQQLRKSKLFQWS